MRILYFLDDGQFFGGAANTLLQQAILMKCAGHEVALVISNYEYEDEVEERVVDSDEIQEEIEEEMNQQAYDEEDMVTEETEEEVSEEE